MPQDQNLQQGYIDSEEPREDTHRESGPEPSDHIKTIPQEKELRKKVCTLCLHWIKYASMPS
jgi:hypothetical protein